MQNQGYPNLQIPSGGEPLAESTADQAAQRFDRAASAAHEAVDRIHRRASDVTERVTGRGGDLYEATCSWVSAHPMQALAGAVVVGLLFGLAGRMRR